MAEIILSGRIAAGATQITTSDGTIVYNSASGVTQGLPAVAAFPAYKVLSFINKGAGTVTFSTTISGTANRTLVTGAAIQVLHDGTDWLAAAV